MARKHSSPDNSDRPDMHGGRMTVARSRGALTGILLIIAGAWGLLIPLIGPVVNFGYAPDKTFHFTIPRFWFELLPGAVAIIAGILVLVAANRAVVNFAAWLAVAAGAWFVVGPTLGPILHIGGIGTPIPKSSTIGTVLENLLLFTGIDALILALGAIAVGRLSVVSVRDVRAAQRKESKRDDNDHTGDSAAFDAAEQRGYDRRESELHDGPSNGTHPQPHAVSETGPATGATGSDGTTRTRKV